MNLVLVDNVGIPTFVQTLSHVQHISTICPLYVLYMSLSHKRPVFVFKIPVLSSSNPVFVLVIQPLSSFCHSCWPKLTEKLADKNESSFGFHNFPICHLVSLQPDKKWTFSGLREIQSLSTNCPSTNSSEMQVYHNICGLDISW